jgi:hypothetical protein
MKRLIFKAQGEVVVDVFFVNIEDHFLASGSRNNKRGEPEYFFKFLDNEGNTIEGWYPEGSTIQIQDVMEQ